MSKPAWLPPLITLEQYQGDWSAYLDAVFRIFKRDLMDNPPLFGGRPVVVARDPSSKGKPEAFWHCVSEMEGEGNRFPALRRCERVGWIRAVVENAANAATIETWPTQRGRDKRVCLWYNKEYLVVLRERKTHFVLITTYCTDRDHTVQKLERDMRRARK